MQPPSWYALGSIRLEGGLDRVHVVSPEGFTLCRARLHSCRLSDEDGARRDAVATFGSGVERGNEVAAYRRHPERHHTWLLAVRPCRRDQGRARAQPGGREAERHLERPAER